jgi:lipoprotein-anchoring transpeptidase ErfK/SrfK
MKKFGLLGAFCALVISFAAAAPASAASIVARIDLSSQRMSVYVNGVQRYTWLVSTARRGYVTPVGSYRPIRMELVYYSKKYDNAPMPHAVFFRGGYAVHGTYSVGSLGRPVSHGCVRLAPSNAATLFSLVSQYGPGNSRIVVSY